MKSNRIKTFFTASCSTLPLRSIYFLIGQRPRNSLKILLITTFFLSRVNFFYGQTEVLFYVAKKH